MNFVRPNILGFSSESVFDRDFSKPIRLGMAKNASPKEKYDSLAMSNEFYSKVEPFVHRVDETTLRKDLGPMQHVILHVRQTRMQAKIYQAQKRQQNSLGPFDLKKNFLSLYASLRPINFHPGSLLFHSETSKKQTVSSDDDANVEEWWRGTVEQEGTENVKGVLHGNKVVLLYHLLAYADMIGDKVVIFANSLDTLNYVEYALQLDWAEQVPNLLSSFPGKKLGEWRKGEQYFRIDGSVDPYERGQLVDAFESDRNANAFLLSKAGGMGINLVS